MPKCKVLIQKQLSTAVALILESARTTTIHRSAMAAIASRKTRNNSLQTMQMFLKT